MSPAAFNGYAPPSQFSAEELYGPDPYNFNFSFPVDFARLETDRVALQPFIPRIHAPLYFEQVSKHASLEEWLPFRTDTLEFFLTLLENWRRDPGNVLFAVIDKGRPSQDPRIPDGGFAGVIGLFYTSASTLSTEIGPVMTFPDFQRSHVTSNAVGLLLRYTLEVPNKGGLGLRRVQWKANPLNVASTKAATRMGFKQEAILRWSFPLHDEKKVGHGRPLREGDPLPSKPGRDSALLAITCEDWEAGGRELVQTLLDRK
ncbi:acyl-CoA N-acyltransferase [Peniophora sp. CONT]|nr:acyl-CoA N-acyltransferase [Peniophora sp. CONT]